MSHSSQQGQTQTTQQLTPQQQQLMEQAAQFYMQFAGSNPTMPTGSQAVSPFTASQTAGQNAVLGAAGLGTPQRAVFKPGAGPTGGAAGTGVGTIGSPNSDPTMQGTVNTAAGTNQYLSSGAFLDPGSNPYVQNAVGAATAPIFQDLSQRTLPAQQATAASGSGVNYGGNREGIQEAQDVTNAYRAAGQAGAGIMNTALGQGLQATNQAIAQAPTTAGSLAMPGATASAVGDVQQAQNQALLNANNQAAWFQQMLPLLKGQELTAGAAGLPGGGTMATGNQVNNANPVSQAIGLVAALGGLTGGMGKLMNPSG